VVHRSGGPFVIETLALVEPAEDEVLVRIVATGMCHTDLIARDQYYPVPLPIVLGHEGAGVVEEVGRAVRKVVPGDPVVLTFMSCGGCASCIRAEPAYCAHGQTLCFGGARRDGSSGMRRGKRRMAGHFFGQSSFATHALANERNVVKVPRDAPLELLGPLGCGIQTGAGSVMNALQPPPGASFVAFGAGAVGLSAVMAAHIVGAATIIAVDRIVPRLELALELGATHVIDATRENVVARIREITRGGADFALELTGLPAVVRQAIDALATRGSCGIVGAAPLGTEASFDLLGVMAPGKTIRGIIEGDSLPDRFIPTLVELHRQGRFPIQRLMKFYLLDEINQAAADSAAGRTIKPMIRPA
jgi:aryl-alcohol dehydrogenase